MSKPTVLLILLSAAIAVAGPAVGQQQVLTICDYESPESRIADLGLQGSFSWYDGPYADDRNRIYAASLTADYSGLYSSESFAQQFDARADVRGKSSGWTVDLDGTGSVLAFLDESLFAVGAFGIDASNEVRLEADLTAGIGTGRFRDVTPLAQAIRIQNVLLDRGELLAPVSNETLLDLAQILGEVGPSDDER
ncbi:hypothetical protein KJ567_05065, partial [Candidatus Bipolaricaulota bacterium]|nr:hypothetical protein [Candidatus Bipolaricaulota bacterium]